MPPSFSAVLMFKFFKVKIESTSRKQQRQNDSVLLTDWTRFFDVSALVKISLDIEYIVDQSEMLAA